MTNTQEYETRASKAQSAQPRWRKARKAPLLLALALGGVMAGCGGAALTSGIIQGEQKYFSFDNVIGTQEPRDVSGIMSSMETHPNLFGIDTVSKIETKFTSAGGTCSRSAGYIQCYIERSRVSRDCFRNTCSLVRKEWSVLIRAPDVEGSVRPKVKIELRANKSNLNS